MDTIFKKYEKQAKDLFAQGLSSGIGLIGLSLAFTMFWLLSTAWFVAWYAEAYNNLSNGFLWAIVANISLFGLIVVYRTRIKTVIVNRLLVDSNEDESSNTEDSIVDDASIVKNLALMYFDQTESQDDQVSAEAKAEITDTVVNLGLKIFERYKLKSAQQETELLGAGPEADKNILITQKLKKMELEKMKSTLQDLIIRLQDAEKGYLEIKNGIADATLSNWMQVYANERHRFHQELEKHMKDLGGEANVKTSILGDIHRLFIDIKLNNLTNDYDAVVNEIKRGSEVLISDYENALKNLDFPKSIHDTLTSQMNAVKQELREMLRLKRSDAFSEA
ncbi:MAG: PA2169 family four-helix-bundle protein [Saprospiraceae bacterium]|nr:PA2169 family four-helix-bundle protein [Saprospiraceae bacterium]